MGSLTVYLGRWGVSQFTSSNYYSDPSHMFVWAPTSFGWRELLLQGTPYAGGEGFAHDWYYIGTVLVSIWLYLIFLLLVGYGYSFFWSVRTIIYLLLCTDMAHLDAVYGYLVDDACHRSY